MAQFNKAQLNADIAGNIYTNSQKLIKGNTVRQRLLNLKDSSLNAIDDLNIPHGYFGIDSAGRVDVSFINSASQTGKYLRDDGTWQPVSTGLPDQTGNNGKILFTDGVNASWTALTASLITTSLGYNPLSDSLAAGNVLIGNGSNTAASVTFSLNTTAGSFNLSTSGVLTMPNANTTTRGLLTAADWNTFNNKVAKTGSNAAGQVVYFFDANTITSTSDITFSSNVLSVNGQIISLKNMYSQSAANMSVGGSFDVNTTASNSFSYSVNADTILNIKNMANGMTVVIDVTQDVAMSHNLTFNSPDIIKWKDATSPVLTTTANKTDVFTFIKSNNIIYGFYTQNF